MQPVHSTTHCLVTDKRFHAFNQYIFDKKTSSMTVRWLPHFRCHGAYLGSALSYISHWWPC